METVLVTGASGFLGMELLRQLLAKGRYRVIASTNSGEKLISAFGPGRIEIVGREELLSERLAERDILCAINCAYPRNKSGFEMAEGLGYIESVLRRIARSRVRTLINISSQSVYDPARSGAASEDCAPCLTTPYAVGKYMTERLADALCEQIPHTSLRMSSLIGPGFNQRIVNRFTEKALKMEPLFVKRSPQRFGFLDCEDAAGAILSLLETDSSAWKAVYNVGSGVGYTLEDIVQAIERVFAARGRSFPEVHYEPGDEAACSCVDGSRLTGDTGFCAHVSLEQSVEKILDWYVEHQA